MIPARRSNFAAVGRGEVADSAVPKNRSNGRLASAPAVIVSALAKVHWYRLQPRHMHFIDNSRGFGHRERVDLGGWP